MVDTAEDPAGPGPMHALAPPQVRSEVTLVQYDDVAMLDPKEARSDAKAFPGKVTVMTFGAERTGQPP